MVNKNKKGKKKTTPHSPDITRLNMNKGKIWQKKKTTPLQTDILGEGNTFKLLTCAPAEMRHADQTCYCLREIKVRGKNSSLGISLPFQINPVKHEYCAIRSKHLIWIDSLLTVGSSSCIGFRLFCGVRLAANWSRRSANHSWWQGKKKN